MKLTHACAAALLFSGLGYATLHSALVESHDVAALFAKQNYTKMQGMAMKLPAAIELAQGATKALATKTTLDGDQATITLTGADGGHIVVVDLSKGEVVSTAPLTFPGYVPTGEVTTTESGLQFFTIKQGEGAQPTPTQTVEVHYTGWFTDGTKFDSSRDRGQPAEFPLNRVIAGWTEGVGMMKVGGQRKFVIPYDLAYGAQGRPGIPPKSTLVFDVELLKVK